MSLMPTQVLSRSIKMAGKKSSFCNDLKPDRNFSKLSNLDTNLRFGLTPLFSITLAKNMTLEIGLKLLRTDGSRLDFFKSGWTTAWLKEVFNAWSYLFFMLDKTLHLAPVSTFISPGMPWTYTVTKALAFFSICALAESPVFWSVIPLT